MVIDDSSKVVSEEDFSHMPLDLVFAFLQVGDDRLRQNSLRNMLIRNTTSALISSVMAIAVGALATSATSRGSFGATGARWSASI